MSRLFYHVMQDNAGNLLFDVSGTMRVAGSGTLATIYGDEALTVILPNPMTNHPSFGSFKCFLGAGDYDFHMAKAGYTFETLTGVQGHGSMAQQDANAVAITGGAISVARLGVNIAAPATTSYVQLNGPVGIGLAPDPALSLKTAFASEFGGNVRVNGGLGINRAANGVSVEIAYNRASAHGIGIFPSADTGTFTMNFANAAGATVGSINTTGAATAFNTTSDGRLKEALLPLTGALDTLMHLLPRTFRWKSTGEVGHGFVAEEVVQVVPGVTTGTPGAVHADGSIDPMQMDNAKLVVWLVGAMQEVVQRLEAIEARLA